MALRSPVTCTPPAASPPASFPPASSCRLDEPKQRGRPRASLGARSSRAYHLLALMLLSPRSWGSAWKGCLKHTTAYVRTTIRPRTSWRYQARAGRLDRLPTLTLSGVGLFTLPTDRSRTLGGISGGETNTSNSINEGKCSELRNSCKGSGRIPPSQTLVHLPTSTSSTQQDPLERGGGAAL